ncbi:hypothetical protein [Bacillus sp. Bos-x628]|uniref:hypothetical protein n=1 Tax=Bacillus maqinnsis TaxID=3229854 RepID=UPI003390031E
MANVERGEATINLDKVRTIKFDLNSLIEVEESLGITLAEIGENLSIKAMRTLLTAGLRHEDAELTEHQVGSMITMDNMADVQEALSVAMGGNDLKN